MLKQIVKFLMISLVSKSPAGIHWASPLITLQNKYTQQFRKRCLLVEIKICTTSLEINPVIETLLSSNFKMKPTGYIALIIVALHMCRSTSDKLLLFSQAFRKCSVYFIQLRSVFSFNESFIDPFVNNYSPISIGTFNQSKKLTTERIVNLSIPLERTVSGLHRKFLFCTLSLVNVDFMFHVSGNNVSINYNTIRHVLGILSFTKEDPTVICFVQINTPLVHNIIPRTPYGTLSIAQTLKYISFTSVFLFIRSDMEVLIMCMSCNSTVSSQLIPSDFSAVGNYPEMLRHSWNNIHRNLHGALVSVPGFGLPILQQLCNKPFNLRTPENICVGVAIASLYNFTTIVGPQSNRYAMAAFDKDPVAGTKFVQQRFFQRLSVHQYIWIPFACSYNPYVFVTFFTHEHMSMEVLLEPLDVWIWLSYCSFLIFTVLCIGMLKGNTGNRSLLRRASDAFMWTISVTLEQSEKSINTKSGDTPTPYGWGVILLTYISCTGCVLTAFAVGLA
jgi:hypothetical protein